MTGALAWLGYRISRHEPRERLFQRPAMLLACLIVAQILLGGTIVWTSRAVLPATAHVATGALLLATTWFLTLRTYLHLEALRSSAPP